MPILNARCNIHGRLDDGVQKGNVGKPIELKRTNRIRLICEVKMWWLKRIIPMASYVGMTWLWSFGFYGPDGMDEASQPAFLFGFVAACLLNLADTIGKTWAGESKHM